MVGACWSVGLLMMDIDKLTLTTTSLCAWKKIRSPGLIYFPFVCFRYFSCADENLKCHSHSRGHTKEGVVGVWIDGVREANKERCIFEICLWYFDIGIIFRIL